MKNLWKQITPSDFTWEREALDYAREILPDHEPYRAWANFEFIAQNGSINEVDLLVLTPKGLFLVEIKSHPGAIRGDANTWIWEKPDGGIKAFDNPRLLADRKAKKLASLLKTQASARKSKETIPFINTVVFLSAENVVNKLQGPARLHVCTRKNFLDEIAAIGTDWRHRTLNKPTSKMVARALEEAGIKESTRTRRVGQYQLTQLLDESDHFQDWLAQHTESDVIRKVRIYLTYGKSEAEAQRLEKAAQLEFRLLEGLEHPGILKVKDLQRHDHGPALVYEHDREAHRLDHLLLHTGENKRLETSQALSLMRSIAEAVRYAHSQRLYHRALSPQSVYVKEHTGGELSIKIGNWSTAERIYETETQQISAFSHLTQFVQEEAGGYVALESHSGEADGPLMDVFSLGTIAYHLFTGKPPANSELELQDKLSGGTGLQVTDELNGASDELQMLVQYATHPDNTQRMDSVDEFMEYLDLLEEEITRPDTELVNNPTEARKGDTFEGGITVLERLGRGASSVVFLVEAKNQQHVLKMAASPDHNERLREEGRVLGSLRHQSIIAHHRTLEIAGHTSLLLDHANADTLAKRLRKLGPVQLELLERFGDDLLSAVTHLEDRAIFHRDIKPENLGLITQGSQLHLVLFDFSLANVKADNLSAGTLAYMDPFIKDPGRRRWDDYAERFSAALTLYEMAAGTLPGWAANQGLPTAIEGDLEIDRTVFDPSVRDKMVSFFEKALVRDVRSRFANGGEMLKAWRQIFLEARQSTQHITDHGAQQTCPIEEAQLDTQIGLLPLSPQALDALSRRNINTVSQMVKLNRSKVRVWPGVGSATRKELSDVIALLQRRLQTEQQERHITQENASHNSIDRLFAAIMPQATKATDPTNQSYLNEYLGRLDSEPPQGIDTVHWPTPLSISAQTSISPADARQLQEKLTAQWSKNAAITELRHEIYDLLLEKGQILTAIELAEALLLRRGSIQDSPIRERWAQAVTRAAVDTELSKQQPRWNMRRIGKRLLLADDTQGRGEELADYAEALGQLADECATQRPLFSPLRALERIRSVPAPESFEGLSSARLLRLAAATSQGAALSSRAEFYPVGMKAEQAIELAQGALLGSNALSVKDVQDRVRGRYPAAEPLPGRPQLDDLIQQLDMGFVWDPLYSFRGGHQGGYCLPKAGLTSFGSRSVTHLTELSHESADETVTAQDVKALERSIQSSVSAARFLALTVRPQRMHSAKEKLIEKYQLHPVSFDELLLRHLKQHCSTMKKPPDWQVVLKADAMEQTARGWQNLQRLVQRVLPDMAAEIRGINKPILLTEPGLIARYGLINTWLNDLRQELESGSFGHSLILLVVSDAQQTGAHIDGNMVPHGAGSSQFARIPSVWLDSKKTNQVGVA